MKIICGILCRSRKRSSALIVSARSTSGSTTTTATSLTSNAPCASWSSSTEPGQSRIVQRSPRKLAFATLSSVDICRARASGEWSPTELPSRTLPRRLVLPPACSMASSKVVLPERYGPISAAQRGASVVFAMGASIILRSRRRRSQGRQRLYLFRSCAPAGGMATEIWRAIPADRGDFSDRQLRYQSTAGAIDAPARIAQHFGRGGVGDAEVRRQPEGGAVHHSDARFFQQIADKILVIRDRPAGRGALADDAGAGRVHVERPLG